MNLDIGWLICGSVTVTVVEFRVTFSNVHPRNQRLDQYRTNMIDPHRRLLDSLVEDLYCRAMSTPLACLTIPPSTPTYII